MLKRYGSYAKPPILLIHGGAGLYKDNRELLERRKSTIPEIIAQVWPLLRSGESAVKTVCRVVELLEDISRFNAGRGYSF